MFRKLVDTTTTTTIQYNEKKKTMSLAQLSMGITIRWHKMTWIMKQNNAELLTCCLEQETKSTYHITLDVRYVIIEMSCAPGQLTTTSSYSEKAFLLWCMWNNDIWNGSWHWTMFCHKDNKKPNALRLWSRISLGIDNIASLIKWIEGWGRTWKHWQCE
jgi:hypothetical protein